MNVFTKIVLLILGITLAGYGLACFANIQILVESVGFVVGGSVTVELLAMYGGLQTGLGLLLLYCGLNHKRGYLNGITGLFIALSLYGAIFIARLLAAIFYGFDAYNSSALFLEVVSIIAIAVALYFELKQLREHETKIATGS